MYRLEGEACSGALGSPKRRAYAQAGSCFGEAVRRPRQLVLNRALVLQYDAAAGLTHQARPTCAPTSPPASTPDVYPDVYPECTRSVPDVYLKCAPNCNRSGVYLHGS